MKTRIKNVRIITDNGLLYGSSIVFDSKILSLGDNNCTNTCTDTCTDDCSEIDGSGLTLWPGLIDQHIHGCGGFDTMDANGAVENMAKLLPKGGVTSFLATTVSASPADMLKAAEGVRAAKKSSQGANVLGIHFEGPYLCTEYKGAHDQNVLTPPDLSVLDQYADCLVRVTIAPELKGAEEFIRKAASMGIHCSIGHTAAPCELCLSALEWGANCFTHTYNAMTPLHHRKPGAVGAAMTGKGYCELICDNIHVHPIAQRALCEAAGDRMVLITDALSPAMLGDGPFTLGTLSGEIKNGAAYLPDGTLAGSVLTLNKAVRNFMKNTGITEVEAARYASRNPAVINGFGDSKGKIQCGYDADLVLMDNDQNVIKTFVGGKVCFE